MCLSEFSAVQGLLHTESPAAIHELTPAATSAGDVTLSSTSLLRPVDAKGYHSSFWKQGMQQGEQKWEIITHRPCTNLNLLSTSSL